MHPHRCYYSISDMASPTQKQYAMLQENSYIYLQSIITRAHTIRALISQITIIVTRSNRNELSPQITIACSNKTFEER